MSKKEGRSDMATGKAGRVEPAIRTGALPRYIYVN